MAESADPLAVIEKTLHNVRAVMRGMMSDHAITERILLDSEIEQCDRAIVALASLKHERAKNIEAVARLLMAALCPFEGVSGDFDRCSSVTRQIYEEKAATVFGLTLDDYYSAALDEEQERNTNVG